MSPRAPIPLSKALSPDECNAEVFGASLAGRNALITGGASGLGAAIALAYAEKGAYVTLVDRNEPLGTSLASDLRSKGFHAQFVPGDVTSWPSQVAAFKAAVAFHPAQRLDIVVASAGVLGDPFVAPDEAPVADLAADPPRPRTDAWEVNTIGLAFTAKLAQLYFEYIPPASASSPSSSSPPPSASPSSTPPPKTLILLASLAAYVDFPLAAAYASSKGGVRGAFKNVRTIFARRGHRCNMLAPWVIATPMTTAGGLVGTIEALGAGRGGDVGQVVRAAVRFADDEGVNGRSWAVGPHRIFDMGDDAEGGNGELGVREFYANGMPQWGAMAERMLAGV